MKITASAPNIEIIAKESSCTSAKNILLIGVFHGEEPQGEYAINRYLQENNLDNLKNNLFFIPCLNPWGKERGIRTNKNDVDLNRNFPTKNWKLTAKDEYYSGDSPASEVETKFMIQLLDELKPDAILSLHAPLKCVNYDGPAEHLAKKIANFCNYPVEADLGYPTPGSFGTYCGIERNIPIVTLEYDDKENLEDIYLKTMNIFDWLAFY